MIAVGFFDDFGDGLGVGRRRLKVFFSAVAFPVEDVLFLLGSQRLLGWFLKIFLAQILQYLFALHLAVHLDHAFGELNP